MIRNLEERIEFLSAVLERTNEGVVACDSEGTLVYFNRKAIEMHGISNMEIPAERWPDHYDLYHVDGVTKLDFNEVPLYRALHDNNVENVEMILARKDQSPILLSVNGQALYDSEGHKIGAIVTLRDITESRKEDERLHTRFHAVFQQSPLGIQIYSKEGVALLVNQAWKQMWKYSDEFIHEEILNKYNVLNDSRLEAKGLIQYFRKGFEGEITQVPDFYYDPSAAGLIGEACWMSCLIYPLKNKRGDVLEVVIISQDLTNQQIDKVERESLLSQLQYERNQLETILKQLPAGIMVLDSSGNINLRNERFAKFSVLNNDAIAFKADGSLYQRNDLPVFRSLYQGEEIQDEEIRINYKNGSTAIINSSSAPIPDSTGKIAAAVVIATDITEKKREEDVQKFLAEIKSVLLSALDYENILDKIATSSLPFFADGCIVDFIEDKDIKRLITRHHDPEIEKVMGELIKFAPDSNSPNPSSRVINSGKSLLINPTEQDIVPTYTKNEEHAELVRKIGIRSYICVPLRVRGRAMGALNFLISSDRRRFDKKDLETAEDLGHHVALVIEKAELYKDARNAIQLRDEFISIASHELKTPLTALILQVEVLSTIMESVDTDEKALVSKVLNSTNRQLDRLGHLVDDMLDISRIASGKMKFRSLEVNIVDLTDEVLDRFRDQLMEQKIELHFEIKKPIVLKCDPYRIEQVITNLMTNAIRYGEKTPIKVDIIQNADRAILAVQDGGRGIALQDHERIFKRFERAVASDDIIGLGLGLFISNQIAQEHGGKISVESELGKGAKFILELPLG